MKALIKIEINRIWKNKIFLFAIMIGLFLSVYHYIEIVYPCTEYLNDYQFMSFGSLVPCTWYDRWIGGECYSSQTYNYFLLIPFFAAAPSAITLAMDKKTGFQYQMFIRIPKSKYYLAKGIVASISGGIAVVLPMIINIWLSIITLPSILPDPATGTFMGETAMWSSFFFEHPQLYILCYLILIFAFSETFALFAMVIGEITKSVFLSSIFPEVLYIFVFIICDTLEFENCAPFFYLTPAQRASDIKFNIIVWEWIALGIACVGLLIMLIKKNETIE